MATVALTSCAAPGPGEDRAEDRNPHPHRPTKRRQQDTAYSRQRPKALAESQPGGKAQTHSRIAPSSARQQLGRRAARSPRSPVTPGCACPGNSALASLPRPLSSVPGKLASGRVWAEGGRPRADPRLPAAGSLLPLRPPLSLAFSSHSDSLLPFFFPFPSACRDRNSAPTCLSREPRRLPAGASRTAGPAGPSLSTRDRNPHTFYEDERVSLRHDVRELEGGVADESLNKVMALLSCLSYCVPPGYGPTRRQLTGS
ncbi:PREDICTED: uncharacterized protein LOC102025908 [Chinchilla lanigera]|uniref:uncharacterized protein LOC102025908 n=1 Tax=Chinchilla lanigera TaxID=34839 RepID=UPI00038E9B43|nr:PREDICTED: uncharacterized protein LOC102025908 [Chinchilla lanigera]